MDTSDRPVHLALDTEEATRTLCCDRPFLELLPRGHRLTARRSACTCPAQEAP